MPAKTVSADIILQSLPKASQARVKAESKKLIAEYRALQKSPKQAEFMQQGVAWNTSRLPAH